MPFDPTLPSTFGRAPQPGKPADHFPGISGSQFNAVEANKCWAQNLKREKEARATHQFLDHEGKLGLSEEWARGVWLKDDVLPGGHSLQGVYKKLGWRVNIKNGQSVQPNPFAGKQKKGARQRSRSKEDKDGPGSRTRSHSQPVVVPRCVDGKCTVAGVSWTQSSALGRVIKPKAAASGTAVAAARQLGGGGGTKPPQRKASSGARRQEKVAKMVRQVVAKEMASLLSAAEMERTQLPEAVGGGGACGGQKGKLPTAAASLSLVATAQAAAVKRAHAQQLQKTSSAPALATAARAAERQGEIPVR